MKLSCAWVLAALSLHAVGASGQDWALPLYDGADGASCEYFNIGARVKWRDRRGSWIDANGSPQGSVPLAVAAIDAIDGTRAIEWDITAIARSWLADSTTNTGLALLTVPGRPRGIVQFHSREADDRALQPRLLLEFADGSSRQLGAAADAHLDCSTVRSLGSAKLLRVASDATALIRFDLASQPRSTALKRATMVLTTQAKRYGPSVVGIYRLSPPVKEAPRSPQLGLASAYPGDRGIDKDPDVFMAAGFESPAWWLDWNDLRLELTLSPVASDPLLGFEPLVGKALRVRVAGGGHLGMNVGYDFKSALGEEPEEAYFRYYLRFGSDWLPTVEGGKLPGFAGTYGRAGWGGRKADPNAGWSMRGSFARSPGRDNPLRDYITLGTYAYHAGGQDIWGDEWTWDLGLRGLLQRNRWYSIEQYFKVNRLGESDGELKVWIDGELAAHRTGIRVRDVPQIRIEKVWMNVYHGGQQTAPADMHLFIDNVVIARRYIGPMLLPRGGSSPDPAVPGR